MATQDHVLAAEALVERFGEWPSFHDAEVMGLALDSGQRSDGKPSIEMEVHLFRASGEKDAEGRIIWRLHTVATFRFVQVAAVSLKDFWSQNVLDDLIIEKLPAGFGDRFAVSLTSNNGLEGSFQCGEVQLAEVKPFEPGPYSVYGRSDR